MKKSIFLMAGLIGLALTSCDDTSDLGVMQKNEAPVVVPADGVAIKSLYASDGNHIDLQNYEESVNIPLIDIALSADFPESSKVAGLVEIADNADFTDAKTIILTSSEVSDGNADLKAAIDGETRMYKGYVDINSWEDAFVSFYGLNPASNVNYVRYKLWLNNDTQNVILYNQDGKEWWNAMKFTVTPLDAKLDVAPSYTFHYLTNMKDEQKVVMYHNPDKHVYDDPVFNATVEVTENADESANVISWWITPEDSEGRPYGVSASDPTAESGRLGIIDLNEFTNGQLDTPGVYKIEVNMLTLDYSVKLAPPSLYVVSTSYITFDKAAQLGTTDNIQYEGLAGIEGAWGLTGQAAFKPTLYSNNAEVAATTENGVTTGGLIFDTSGAPLNSNSAIPLVGQRGMFYVTANLQTLQYTTYRCSTMGITGSLNNWGETADIALTNSRTTYYMQWSGKVTLNAGDEWKIRANSEWVVNFGGANGSDYATDGSHIELAKDGANLVAAESGTYNVTVYFRRTIENGQLTPYYMTVTPAN